VAAQGASSRERDEEATMSIKVRDVTLHRSDVLRVFSRSTGELEREIRAVIGDVASVSAGVSGGVVRLSGRVARGSEAIRLVEKIRRVEGVIDVVSELTYDRADLLVVPPLL
jgi:hypothetical protein